jgi:putative ABC transport system permease protein
VFVALCANVGSLLLARLTSRRHQFSVCSALGASRGRVMRQASAESALIGVIAVAGGVAGAWMLVALARSFLPDAWLLSTLNPVNIDRRALAVASGAGIMATLAAGLLPAWIGTRVNAGDSLRLTDRTGTETRGSRSLTRALLVGELALACTLLVGATLLVRTFVNLTRADRGLDTNGVLTATMSLPRRAFDTAAARAAAAQTAEAAIRTLPGVEVAAWSYGLPPSGGALSFGVWRADGPQGLTIDMDVERYDVGPEFFALYQIPLLRGRTFQSNDSERAVVVGERLARLLWPNQDPIGRSYSFLETRFEVIGVAREITLPSIDATHDRPEFYQRFGGVGTYAMLSVRCSGPCPPPAIARQRVMAAVPAIEVNQVRPLEEAYDEELARPRATAALGAAFAGIAVIAAAAGLFSLLSYTAIRRKKEFGIRTALGASAQQVAWLVFRDGLIVALAGIALGSLGAWMLARDIGALRYGVTVGDPVSWALVIGLLTMTTLLAAWRPARVASRVDPVLLLRQE